MSTPVNKPASLIAEHLHGIGEAICQNIRQGELTTVERLFAARHVCLKKLTVASLSSEEKRATTALLMKQRDSIRAALQEREAFLLEQIQGITERRNAAQRYNTLEEGGLSNHQLRHVTG